eukprot:350715-Chlamydomonas_euryale.AAC.9
MATVTTPLGSLLRAFARAAACRVRDGVAVQARLVSLIDPESLKVRALPRTYAATLTLRCSAAACSAPANATATCCPFSRCCILFCRICSFLVLYCRAWLLPFAVLRQCWQLPFRAGPCCLRTFSGPCARLHKVNAAASSVPHHYSFALSCNPKLFTFITQPSPLKSPAAHCVYRLLLDNSDPSAQLLCGIVAFVTVVWHVGDI